jgi:hypothetical protein
MSLVGAFTTVIHSTVITIALLIFAASSAMAAPQVVPFEQLGNTTIYPARVIAINFPGYTFQYQHAVTWGAWKARMTLTPPVATLQMPKPNQWGLRVDGLQCENAVQGVSACALFISNGSAEDQYSPWCDLATNTMFRVECPVSLTLDY